MYNVNFVIGLNNVNCLQIIYDNLSQVSNWNWTQFFELEFMTPCNQQLINDWYNSKLPLITDTVNCTCTLISELISINTTNPSLMSILCSILNCQLNIVFTLIYYLICLPFIGISYCYGNPIPSTVYDILVQNVGLVVTLSNCICDLRRSNYSNCTKPDNGIVPYVINCLTTEMSQFQDYNFNQVINKIQQYPC